MTDVLSNTGAMKLKSLVERIERLNEDKAAVGPTSRKCTPRQNQTASTPRSCAR